MSGATAAFAIPGDHTRRTGGFIYERRVLDELRLSGRLVAHLRLPGSFPDARPRDVQQALAQMTRLPDHVALIIDGLVFGAIDTEILARVRVPIVAMVHHPLAAETGLEPDRAAWLALNERANLQLAREIVVPSPHTAAILTGHFEAPENRIWIAPPGIDRDDRPHQPADPPLILSIGLLARRKGHDVLLEALARISDLSWEAQIIGGVHDPSYAAELRAQADRLGLSDRVVFMGEVAQDAIEERYAAATVFALATRYEGYGMVLSEALVRGLPVISCRAGAVPETVPAGAGLLVPPDDPDAFADALRRVLSDPPLREALARGAQSAGKALPSWAETAAVMSAALDRAAEQ